MSKILLVEDDNNLREIYEARLQAEGYDIVAARDGEEALTVAMKERPDLIISDVMMPKISGFDMLDIIRSTEETKDVKVIMMTALSQAEDKERADKLGADRYLVKSQVTLEDVAKVAREVLNGNDNTEKPQSLNSLDTQENNDSQATSTPVPPPTPTSVPTPAPTQSSDEPQTTPATAPVNSQTQDDSPAMSAVSSDSSDDAQALSQSSDQELADVTAQIDSFIDSSSPAPVKQDSEPATDTTPSEGQQPPANDSTTDEGQQPQKSATGKKVIQPLNDPTVSRGPDLHKLLEKEEEKNQMAAIAQDIASKNDTQTVATNEVTDKSKSELTVDYEASAEETLRVAAEKKNHDQEDTATPTEKTPETPETTQETAEHAPEVAISENGNLHLASEPETEQSAPEPASTPATAPSEETEDTPEAATTTEAVEQPSSAIPQPSEQPSSQPQDDQSALAEAAEQLAKMSQQTAPPNIPHTNGTNIDGISGPPSTPTQPQPQTTPAQTNDADDIAL